MYITVIHLACHAEIGNFGAEKIEVPHIAPNYKLLKA